VLHQARRDLSAENLRIPRRGVIAIASEGLGKYSKDVVVNW
tara:strand:- start:512 stop:634 length:123 start_codon:yes stop_codon:yes gene_type:complete